MQTDQGIFMQSKLVAASAALLGLFAGQAVQAEASAWATVNNIKFYVFDMDLNDGVTATASFEAITGQSASTWANANGQGASGPWNTLPSTVSLSYLGASGQASVVGGGTLDSFTLQAQANSSNGTAHSYGHIGLNFTLSKNAMLVLSADTSASATTTLGTTAAGPESAYGYGQVQFYSDSNGASIGSSGYVQAYNWSSTAGQVNNSGNMLAAYYNASGAEVNLFGSVYATAQAEIPLTPVPEPETYAMLLAGLGVLGLLQRRRRS